MAPNKISYIFILLTYFLALTVKCQIHLCSKIYILPMFKQGSTCDILSGSSTGCVHSIRIYIDSCFYSAKNRNMMSVFNFTNQTVFTCLITAKAYDDESFCYVAYSSRNTVNLEEGKNYFIWETLIRQINEDKELKCFNNPLAIFVTDIPYDEFSNYPDVNQIFNLELEQTQKELFDLKMHAYFVFLVHDDPLTDKPETFDIQSFGDLGKLKFTETNNLEFQNMSFLDFTDPESPGQEICVREKFPDPPRPNLPVPKNIVPMLVSGILTIFVFFVMTPIVLFWSFQIYKRWQESKIEEFADEHARNARCVIFGNYYDEWQVTPKELSVNQQILLGFGFSGKVFLGHLKKKRNNEVTEIDVAVKFPHAFNNQAMRMDMIKEIGFMKTLGKHPNLLVMVGYVKSIQEPAIATELCVYGDLLGLLKKHDLHFMSPQKCQKVKVCFLLPDLIRIALQICNGLIHLVNLKYVHRDIAARNVLLSKDLTAKVGDFGLCRLAEEYIYQDKGARIPIKNSPYEALKYGRFSEKSDVWSFGVLMWELFSGGKKPFDDVHVMSFVNHLDDENKLVFPEETPKQLAEIIERKCFQKDPNKRATFVELKSDLYGFYSIVCSVLKEQEKVRSEDFDEDVGSIGSVEGNFGSIRHRV